ncbi:hypothetical protein H4R34_003277 [Dimargaris verticillata]|uniref:PHD-type domain-containing protein n=1 Tax=Dimargaris verticillata TaxID=2761393 RepID=A0A9W8B2G4_9FUNG|nr:hypothetical protein H4R34_003277 [Dimargaris verticillata]
MPTSPAKTGARRRQSHGVTVTPDKSRVEAYLDSLSAKSEHDSDSDSASSTRSQQDDEDEDDSSCAVCGGQDATKRNEILFCDGKDCDMPVHQKCYDIKTIPPDDVSWFCQRCEDKIPASKARVVCCDSDLGALKRTDRPREYVHVVCGLWNPRIDTDSPTQWQVPVESEAANAPCELCKSANGFTVKCCYTDEDQERGGDLDPLSDGCRRYFHVTCAIEHGLVIVGSPPLAATQPLLCSDHRRIRRSSRRGRSRTRLIKDSPSTSKPETVSPVVKKRKLMRKSSTPSAETTPSTGSPRRRKGLILSDDDEDHIGQPANPTRDTPTPLSPSTRSLSAMAVDPSPSPSLPAPRATPTSAVSLPSTSSAPLSPASAPKMAVPGLAITTHPVPTAATKLSPLSTGAGGPSTPSRPPLVHPSVRPRPARRPISTGLSSLVPAPNPLSETTMLSGSLSGPATKATEPATKTGSPRRATPNAISKKPSFLRASAPIHAPTVADASPPSKRRAKPSGAAPGLAAVNSPKSLQPSQAALLDKPLAPASLESPSAQPSSAPAATAATADLPSATQPPITEPLSASRNTASTALLVQDATADKPATMTPKPSGSADLRRSTLQSNASTYASPESGATRPLASTGPARDPPSTLFPRSRSRSRSRSPRRARNPSDRSSYERDSADTYAQGSGDGSGRDEYRGEPRPNRSRGNPRERRPERSSDRSYGRSYERENGEWGRDYYRPREWAQERERMRPNGHDLDSNGITPAGAHSAAAGRDRPRDEWYGLMDEPSVGSARSSRSGEPFNGSGRESGGSGARPPGPGSQARPRKPVSASAAITLNHTASMSSDTAMGPPNYTNGNAGTGDSSSPWLASDQITAALGQAMDDRLSAVVQSIGDIRGKLDALSLPALASRTPGRDLLTENAQLLEENELLKEEVAHWKAEAQVAYDHYQLVTTNLASLRQDLHLLVQNLALPGWQPSRPESSLTPPSEPALGTPAESSPSSTPTAVVGPPAKNLVTSPADPPVVATLPSSSDPVASAEVAENAIDAYIKGLVKASEQIHRQAAGVLSWDQCQDDVTKLVDGWMHTLGNSDEKLSNPTDMEAVPTPHV